MLMNYILSEKKDSELIVIYLKGNEKALSCLINRHKNRLFNFIYSKVFDRDIADDVFQDTFIKVIVASLYHPAKNKMKKMVQRRKKSM